MTKINLTGNGRRNAVTVTPLNQCAEQAAYAYGWIHCNGSWVVRNGRNMSIDINGVKGEESFLKSIAHTFNALDTILPLYGDKIVLRLRSNQMVELCAMYGFTRMKKDRGAVSAEWLVNSAAFWRGVLDSSGIFTDGMIKITIPEPLADQFSKYLYKAEGTDTMSDVYDTKNSVMLIKDEHGDILNLLYKGVKHEHMTSDLKGYVALVMKQGMSV